jgi:secreted PhoX family phosphatase
MKFTFTHFISISAISFPILIASSCTKKSIPPKASQYGLTTTFAGSGYAGLADSIGLMASFNGPAGIIMDAAGNLYVADSGNNEIREITPYGVVSTIAGNINKGSANGTGIAASFANPLGLAIDASGNLYVADSGNNMIRKITTAGLVTTLAGSGAVGATNGTATAATFNNPNGIAVDFAGNVYVNDTGNNSIRMISTTGVVSTLAGSGFAAIANGTGTAASFNTPQGLTFDAAGNLYVADEGNHLIREVSTSGIAGTFAGSGYVGSENGTILKASFNEPYASTLDSKGNMYIADVGNNMIRKITLNDTVTTFAGSGSVGFVNGTGNTVAFDEPFGLITDGSNNLYVSDFGNNVIRKIVIKQ